MARVDPEALEREADELARQAGLIPSDPAPETPDTPTEPQSPPEPQPDTDDDQLPADTDELDRGDPENDVDDVQEIAVLRERYKNAQAAMTRAQQEAAALRRQCDDLRQANDDLRANRPDEQAAPQNADEAEELLAKALEEYPEIVRPLLNRLEKLEARTDTVSETVEDRKKREALEAHMRPIREKHPDVDAIAGSDDFNGWVARQTPAWQRIASSGSPDEVIELLDRYKTAMGMVADPTPQREPAIERARKVAEPTLPRSRKPDPSAKKRMWSRKEIADMPLEDYEQHRDEIDRAYLEGRVR